MLGWVRGGAEVAVRGVALPYLLGLRWLDRRGRETGVVASGGVGERMVRGLKVAVDDLFFAGEVLGGSSAAFLDTARARAEVADALRLYEACGWLTRPERYHLEPPPLTTVDVTAGTLPGLPYLHARFASGYAPWPGEPGRARYLAYQPNRTAHAWLYRHPGAPRPWIVCLPAYRMGDPRVDTVGFRIARLHRTFGHNLAVPVFPFHGPRTIGRRSGDGFLAGDFLDTVHAQAQAVWDTRRLIGWLRRHEAPAVGLYGLSLGAAATTLMAALEDDLACVIAGIPAIDFVDLMDANTATLLGRATTFLGFPWEEVRRMLRIISPLALPRRVPVERCFLFAGAADALAPRAQVLALWRHWGEPRLSWYEGGHVSFLVERAVQRFVAEALRECGLLAA
jgi:dienelactone hydrolase